MTEDRLRKSIDQYGILQPVFVDEDGTVLDGRHRVVHAFELGLNCPVVIWPAHILPETRRQVEKAFRDMYKALTQEPPTSGRA